MSVRVGQAQLNLIKWDEDGKKKKFHLIEKIANKWREVGRLLDIEEAQLDGFSQQYQNNVNECCRAVLIKWRQNPPPGYPSIWGGLIELLDDCQLTEVITELKDALSKANLS